jgi:hypothetical protein
MRRARVGCSTLRLLTSLSLLACTGCHDVNAQLGAFFLWPLRLAPVALVLVCLAIALAFARASVGQAARRGAMLVSLGLFSVIEFSLFREHSVGVPLSLFPFVMACAGTALLMVLPAAARGPFRWLALFVAASLAALHGHWLYALRPGSRLPEGELVDVAVGDGVLCGLFERGGVACLGHNEGGQAGLGHLADTRGWALPVDVGPVVGLRGLKRDVCVLTVRDEVHCWGASFGAKPTRIGAGNQTLDMPAEGVVTVSVQGELRYLRGSEKLARKSPRSSVVVGREVCTLTIEGEVVCGGHPVSLPAKARALRGDTGLACASLNTGGVRCWGSPLFFRLEGEPERYEGVLNSLFAPVFVWKSPAKIVWP